MSYNDIYDDLLYDQPADYFTQALSNGRIKTLGNSLESGYKGMTNTVSNQFNRQVEMVKELSRQINTHSTPIVWVIIFVLFFIIIII